MPDMVAKKLFLASVCLLAPLTALKIADIQPVEIFLLLSSFVFLAVLIERFTTITVQMDLWKLQNLYLLFVVIVGLLACLAVRLPIYPPTELSFLRTPPFLSFSRLTELALCMYGLLLASEVCRTPELLHCACKYYIWAGLLSCLFGLLSWNFYHITGLELGGTYGDANRIRGAFIEGGPFGIYLVSVLLVLLFRWRIRAQRLTRSELLTAAIVIVTFFLAASKAGIGVAIALCILAVIAGRRQVRIRARYIVLATLGSSVLFAVAWTQGLAGYVFNYENFSESVASRPDDTSLVMGRLMAVVLVPRMIADHPVAGIGIANYSVIRNDPHYLEGLPSTTEWDLPGLGLLGYAAELGIPATLFLVVIIWRPVRIVKSRSCSVVVVVLASYQMIAHLFGAQITFFYPWLVTSFALGYSLRANGASVRSVTGKRSLRT